jgi:hypothetical protein
MDLSDHVRSQIFAVRFRNALHTAEYRQRCPQPAPGKLENDHEESAIRTPSEHASEDAESSPLPSEPAFG